MILMLFDKVMIYHIIVTNACSQIIINVLSWCENKSENIINVQYTALWCEFLYFFVRARMVRRKYFTYWPRAYSDNCKNKKYCWLTAANFHVIWWGISSFIICSIVRAMRFLWLWKNKWNKKTMQCYITFKTILL